MLRDRIARLAKDAVWVQGVFQPLKAGRVVRILALEVFQRVREHIRFAVVVGHDPYLLSGKIMPQLVPTVKG
jgi:hypothetical protein